MIQQALKAYHKPQHIARMNFVLSVWYYFCFKNHRNAWHADYADWFWSLTAIKSITLVYIVLKISVNHVLHTFYLLGLTCVCIEIVYILSTNVVTQFQTTLLSQQNKCTNQQRIIICGIALLSDGISSLEIRGIAYFVNRDCENCNEWRA